MKLLLILALCEAAWGPVTNGFRQPTVQPTEYHSPAELGEPPNCTDNIAALGAAYSRTGIEEYLIAARKMLDRCMAPTGYGAMPFTEGLARWNKR
jgi:hypothetical protein